MKDTFLTFKTTDTYEASFYCLYGALITNIEERPLQERLRKKNGYSHVCIFTLENVPSWATDMWHSGYAFGNIPDFVRKRAQIKRQMLKHTHPIHTK